jgi:hypothetical protein
MFKSAVRTYIRRGIFTLTVLAAVMTALFSSDLRRVTAVPDCSDCLYILYSSECYGDIYCPSYQDCKQVCMTCPENQNPDEFGCKGGIPPEQLP